MEAPHTDPELVRGLAEDLAAAGFTVDGLAALWGEEAGAALTRGHRTAALRALDRRDGFSAAAVLARLFVLGLPVAPKELDDALPVTGMRGAVALGLVEQDRDTVGPAVDLRPYTFTDLWGEASWWIASDLGELATGGPLRPDHVLGVGGASVTLSSLLIERPVARTLDLGTGCGIQAMHAARHSGSVVATDISSRALAFARFNLAVNGIRNVELREGSLFEPVSGERFDAIVSNPPFVITPRAEGVPEYEYRDGGMRGDALVAAVIRGVAEHLDAGGIAQLLGNWEYRGDGDAFDRIEGWLDAATAAGVPIDAWIVERDREDPAAYAETWIRDGGQRPGADFDRLTGAWLDDFEDRDVRGVGFGYVTLRRVRGDASPWRRLERIGTPSASGLGAHLAATLDGHDWQAALDDAALAAQRLEVAPDVTEERHYWPGDEHPAVMNLRQGGGFGRSYPLNTALAAVVGACDGELSIAALCDALGDLLEADAAELRESVLPSIREFVTVGILRPAE